MSHQRALVSFEDGQGVRQGKRTRMLRQFKNRRMHGTNGVHGLNGMHRTNRVHGFREPILPTTIMHWPMRDRQTTHNGFGRLGSFSEFEILN
jgi:hypothetical protein